MKNKKQLHIVALVIAIFFVISLVTNILGSLEPNIAESFKLSRKWAGFLPFSFFIAYGVMSIPSGILNEKLGAKFVLLLAFILSFAGVMLFVFFTSYIIALISLFTIGLGMAMLQVVINPLLRASGGEENFAFNSVLAQLFFGGASAICPYLYSYLVLNIHTEKSNFVLDTLNKIVPESLKWISLYWIFALIILLIIIITSATKFPKVELKDDERMGTWANFRELLKSKYTVLFFFGTFAYVGTEQGISYWISSFLQVYHGQAPETVGASANTWFWGLMTIGCILGLVLLKLFDSRKLLCVFVIGAAVSLTVALVGSTSIAIIAFPLCGFFASVMWSIVISLGLNSVPNNHGSFAGILCTGIIGGAVIPLAIGAIADYTGLKVAMLINYITLGYLFSMGIWAKPLVNNSVSLMELFKKKE